MPNAVTVTLLQRQGQAAGRCWPSSAGRKEIALISVSCFLQIATSKSRCGPQINWPRIPMFQFLIGFFIAILAPTTFSAFPAFLTIYWSVSIQYVLLFKLWPTCRSCAQKSTKCWQYYFFSRSPLSEYKRHLSPNFPKQCRNHQSSHFHAIFSHFPHKITPL